jgi:integrase
LSYRTADGRRVRESSKTTDREIAKRILEDKRGRLARGETLLPRVDRITYNEARDDLRTYYETHATRDLAEADARLKHLDRFFAGRRLVAITPDVITAYARARQAPKRADDGTSKPGAANGTINRELATLSKLLRLAYEHGKLQRLPVVKKLREADPRAGFVTRDQFISIRKALPDELKTAATVSYTFGWRKREVLDLKRHQYNAQDGTLRLDPGSTKNSDGRVVHATPELRAMLDAQLGAVRELERKDGRVIAWLFPHLTGPLAGDRIADPRKAWEAACRAAGQPSVLVHDLRRSAVRNMEKAGVPRSVAMKLTGHRTESVYRRYAIVSDADLVDASDKLDRAASRAGLA